MVVIKCSENGFLAVVCEKLLRVYDLRNSALVHKSSFSTNDSKTSELKEENPNSKVTTNTTFTYGCAFSNSGKLLATFSDDKDLVVLRTEDWKQVGKRRVPKRPTSVLFTSKENEVVISDKAGDVYSYSICEENGLSNESLLLGHVSMILDMVLSRDDKYIVTADRDEKIRVSCFPNAYNIQSFCLGHTEYVWKLIMPENNPKVLVSASGDGTLRFWNYTLGKSIHVEEFSTLKSDVNIVSCLAYSKRENIVFVGFEASLSLYIFKLNEDITVQKLSSSGLALDGPPCSLAVDYTNCLWVVQSYKNAPLVVFEMSIHGDCCKFSKRTTDDGLVLTTEDLDLIYEASKQRPCLASLKKKEDLGTAEYFDRKKDRLEAKRKKGSIGTQSKKIKT